MSNIGSIRNAVVGQSGVTGPSLKVGSDTKLEDVGKFLRDNDGKTKVYGHKDKVTGAVTLYVSDKKTSLFDRITQRSATRREVARAEIGRLLGGLTDDLQSRHDGKQLSANVRGGLTEAFGNLKTRMMAPDNRALRSNDILKAAAAARGLSSVVEERESSPSAATHDLDQALSRAPGNSRAYADRPVTTFTTGLGGAFDAPQISVGGKDYVATRYLASGGFGDVCAYRAADGSMLAVKLGKLPDEENGPKAGELHQEAAKEIAMNLEATKNGSANLLEMKGAFALADGRVGVALEFAPNGTVHSLGSKIIDSIAANPTQVGAGQITRAEADVVRLTVLKDMAAGVRQLHDAGVTHFDFKSPNCLVGQDGTVKVADFGGSYAGTVDAGSNDVDSASPRSVQISIDAAAWKAPEMTQAESFAKASKTALRALAEATQKDVVNHLKVAFSGKDDSWYEQVSGILTKNRTDNMSDDALKMARVDNNVDLWGLGTSALDMFSKKGVNATDLGFQSAVESRTEKWASNENSVALGSGPGTLAGSTGDDSIDDLLSTLLSPNPDTRKSFFNTYFDGHGAMQRPGVGSPEARALVAALASGDNQRIAAARTALTTAFP